MVMSLRFAESLNRFWRNDHDSADVCGTAVTGCPVAAVNNALPALIAGAGMAALGIIAVLVCRDMGNAPEDAAP